MNHDAARQQAIEVMAEAIETRARAWLMATGAVTLDQVNRFAPEMGREFSVVGVGALLVARQDEVCGTCGGTGEIECPLHVGTATRGPCSLCHPCPDCIDGRVSGGPLMILGPKQVGWRKGPLPTEAQVQRQKPDGESWIPTFVFIDSAEGAS